MKKYINMAIFYAVLAMLAGVFYREFTKYMNFEGSTSLLRIHPHLFTLGMMMYLLIYLISLSLNFDDNNKIDKHLKFYNIGLILSAVMMFVRGLTEVLAKDLSNGQEAMISGMAGLGHVILGVSLILILLDIKKLSSNKVKSL